MILEDWEVDLIKVALVRYGQRLVLEERERFDGMGESAHFASVRLMLRNRFSVDIGGPVHES